MTLEDQGLMLRALYEEVEVGGTTIKFDTLAEYEKWKSSRGK